MADQKPKKPKPADLAQPEALLEGAPLTDSGEVAFKWSEDLQEPPPDKEIHPRRPLPLVPTHKPD